jgi:hypothetical protein
MNNVRDEYGADGNADGVLDARLESVDLGVAV